MSRKLGRGRLAQERASKKASMRSSNVLTYAATLHARLRLDGRFVVFGQTSITNHKNPKFSLSLTGRANQVRHTNSGQTRGTPLKTRDCDSGAERALASPSLEPNQELLSYLTQVNLIKLDFDSDSLVTQWHQFGGL